MIEQISTDNSLAQEIADLLITRKKWSDRIFTVGKLAIFTKRVTVTDFNASMREKQRFETKFVDSLEDRLYGIPALKVLSYRRLERENNIWNR